MLNNTVISERVNRGEGAKKVSSPVSQYSKGVTLMHLSGMSSPVMQMSCYDLCIVLIFVLDVSVLDGHDYLILYLTQTLSLYSFFKSCKIMKHFYVSTLNGLKKMRYFF